MEHAEECGKELRAAVAARDAALEGMHGKLGMAQALIQEGARKSADVSD